MLQQKQDISNAAFFAQLHQPLLKEQAGRVVNRTELENGNHPASSSYSPHILIAMPYTLLVASSMASASVGWAWMVHIKSSTVPSSSIAVTASAISSVACGPMICTPRISP